MDTESLHALRQATGYYETKAPIEQGILVDKIKKNLYALPKCQRGSKEKSE